MLNLPKPKIRAKIDIDVSWPQIRFQVKGKEPLGDVLGKVHSSGLTGTNEPILVVPLGENEPCFVVATIDPNDILGVRNHTADALRIVVAHKAKVCTIVLPDADFTTIQAITEGLLSANHLFESSGPASDRRGNIADLDFVISGELQVSKDALAWGWSTSLASLTARDLATEPPNALTPDKFKEKCEELAAGSDLKISVMEREDLQEAGMNGILTVAAGSDHGAYLIQMDWIPDNHSQESPIVFVGKTVTFDTGGISLKGPQDMDHMKADMGGGAAVFGLMSQVAQLNPCFPVSAVFAVVENMPGPAAMRPGDVIRLASGKTVEIINTDAEGRLILADALHYAKSLDPKVVIDLATLTGATAGIFGPLGIGTFANDSEWFDLLCKADAVAQEYIWRLPLWREYLEFVKSPVADLRNFSTIGQLGSTPTAAAFLSQFVGDHPWLHLDLYNTCWNASPTGMMPPGPTGSGARVLAQMLLEINQSETTKLKTIL